MDDLKKALEEAAARAGETKKAGSEDAAPKDQSELTRMLEQALTGTKADTSAH